MEGRSGRGTGFRSWQEVILRPEGFYDRFGGFYYFYVGEMVFVKGSSLEYTPIADGNPGKV